VAGRGHKLPDDFRIERGGAGGTEVGQALFKRGRGQVGLPRQLNLNGVACLDPAAAQNDAHDPGLADQSALIVLVEDGFEQSGLQVVDLVTRVVQTSYLDDGLWPKPEHYLGGSAWRASPTRTRPLS
jgi:hypothetical protein